MKKIFCLLIASHTLLTVSSCKKGDAANIITVLTNRVEFASYIELFNAEHETQKAVLVYKEDVNASLSELRAREADIIVGSFLDNARSLQYFADLSAFFGENKTSAKIDKNAFYPAFFDPTFFDSAFSGAASSARIYLLPVSFNLPIMLYATLNDTYIPASAQKSQRIDMENIKKSAAQYNKKNAAVYTNMGFGVTWNYDFLWLCAKLYGIAHNSNTPETKKLDEEKNEGLKKYLRDFVAQNTSASFENEFAFRYLYQQPLEQAASAKSLYIYSTSAIFSDWINAASAANGECNFLWITQDAGDGGKLLCEDDAVFLGKYKKSKNKDADVFIAWFFQEATQKKLLARSNKMNITGQTFGLAGGFSALKSVNENFGAYYPMLKNLPDEQQIMPPIANSTDNMSAQKAALIHELLQAIAR
ncbi:MAG: extracellular solute-binding protein [Treponemataceae bacterium]|nr:MAG: extracellular solute-binding protein [Treponemataceae bacterium]